MAAGESNKKKIENLAVFLIILIVTVIAINTIWKTDTDKKTSIQDDVYIHSSSNTEVSSNNTNLEESLEKILGKIEGVGKVSVLITYNESSQIVAMYSETTKESSIEETDTNGGNRKTAETDISKDVVFKEENGQKTPVTEKLIMPKIEGAIITAVRCTGIVT